MWGARRGLSPCFYFRTFEDALSCVREPGSPPGFLSDSLQRPTGSLKTDSSLDGTTDNIVYIHAVLSYRKTYLHTMSVNAWMQALVHTLANVHLCPSTPQDYLLWHVLQLHKHTNGQTAISHLCSCMMQHDVAHRGFSWGPLHLKSLYSCTHTHTPQCQIRMAM